MGKKISIIVPTYQEVANIPTLLQRVAAVATEQAWDAELLVMDDNSRDGTDAAIVAANIAWVRLITRTANRGLSPAVLEGFSTATGDYLFCMDADLSHPPEKLPDMIKALDDGADFVLGSRYVRGGTTDDDWGVFRWLNSQIATLIARPLTHIKDPMSGFFGLRRSQFERGTDFQPTGYKIGLELLIRCRCEKPVELPIHFADRQRGESKLSMKQQILYLQHVRRLLIFKYGTWSYLVQFLFVGAIGAAINLAALTLALQWGAGEKKAILIGIGLSFYCNFVLNRRFTFSYARDRNIISQLLGFTSASLVGAVVNYAVTLLLAAPRGPIHSTQVAAALGIMAGAGLNFVSNRFFVFRIKHYKPKDEMA